ncbi:hypothetical protein D3C78_1662440 [compost metagenome]
MNIIENLYVHNEFGVEICIFGATTPEEIAEKEEELIYNIQKQLIEKFSFLRAVKASLSYYVHFKPIEQKN